MKLGKFKVISQGLALPASAFGWETVCKEGGEPISIGGHHKGDFLTKELGVTYSVVEDNARKANSNPDAKINAALARHPKIAKRWGKIIKRNKFLRALFIFLFGKKKDIRNWPVWVKKTDEERIQNMPWILQNKDPWVVTEKIDGTSTTFTMKRGKFGKYDFYVCSRNVVFDKPDKNCFYDTNVYLEMAEKYKIEDVLKELLVRNPAWDYVTLQGETYGASIQKREYGLKDHALMAFNLIYGINGESTRFNPIEMTAILSEYFVPCVPIVDKNFILPDTVEEMLAYATNKSAVDGGMREGVVLRSLDGSQSFKAVSNEFLLKYHG